MQSNIDTFVVDQIVDVKLSWQDSNPVEVASGENDRILTFILSNWGNKEDTIELSHISNGANSFSPKPENVRIFQDINNNGIWDSDDKIVDEVTLNSDSNTTLFLVSDIPNSSYSENQKDDEGILATSKSEATNSEDRADKIDIAIRNKSSQDYGTYIIRDYWLESIKSATVDSDDNKTHTGSIITYKITLNIGGNSNNKEISNIKFKDAIPSGTTYIDGSLKLNDVSLSDTKDTDAGYFENNEVVVDVDKIKNSEIKEILFQVKVN